MAYVVRLIHEEMYLHTRAIEFIILSPRIEDAIRFVDQPSAEAVRASLLNNEDYTVAPI